MKLLYMRSAILIAMVVIFVLSLGSAVAYADESDDTVTYQVTIRNLTGGQPFTPPVVAIHKEGLRFFEVGEVASSEIQAIAENGNNEPLLDVLSDNPEVFAFTVGSAAPLVPASDPGGSMLGDSATFTITVDEDAEFLSMATMLICTNDGFTGLDQVELPEDGSKTFLTQAYDASTEINTEHFNDMVPPCQSLISGIVPPVGGTGETNPDLAEGGVIRHHSGIEGGMDLSPALHGWTDPVAEVTITFMDMDDDDADDDD